MLNKDTRITVALKRINQMLYGDSHIKVPEPELRQALETDYDITGRVPDNSDIDELVFAEDGVNPRIENIFPETSRVISEQF